MYFPSGENTGSAMFCWSRLPLLRAFIWRPSPPDLWYIQISPAGMLRLDIMPFVTTKYSPSGLHFGEWIRLLFSLVIWRRFEPSMSITQILLSPSRSDTNAICFPSGEIAGWMFQAKSWVIGVALPPAVSTLYKSPSISNTINLPFGAISRLDHVVSVVLMVTSFSE